MLINNNPQASQDQMFPVEHNSWCTEIHYLYFS